MIVEHYMPGTGELITIQWLTNLWNNMFSFIVLSTGLKYTLNINSPAVVYLGI